MRQTYSFLCGFLLYHHDAEVGLEGYIASQNPWLASTGNIGWTEHNSKFHFSGVNKGAGGPAPPILQARHKHTFELH